jgi:hypothetical protein
MTRAQSFVQMLNVISLVVIKNHFGRMVDRVWVKYSSGTHKQQDLQLLCDYSRFASKVTAPLGTGAILGCLIMLLVLRCRCRKR